MDIRNRVVELRRVRANTLTPHPQNWRTHNDAQRQALNAVLQKIGFAGAILAVERDNGLLVCDGHLRSEEMGEQEVPVLVLDLNDTEVATLLTTFDPISQMAGANKEKLDALLATYDLGKTNGETAAISADLQTRLDGMLAKLAKGAGSEWGKVRAATEDEVPEVPAIPVTEPGDLWVLGNHRLLCGDCTNAEHVAEVLAGGVPFIMVTDPPYGVDYDPQWRHECGLNASDRTGRVTNDTVIDWSACYRLFGGAVVYVWHAGKFAGEVWKNIEDSGFTVRTQIIWRKTAFVIGRGHYHWQHEPCWYGARAGNSAKWNGSRTESTVWDIVPIHATRGTTDDAETIHGTQKPVECMARPIRNHGGPEDDVYDPFVGSGTTIIACEQLGRRCRAVEVDPGYVDVAATRWQRFTSQEPILESTGETFTQVKARREQTRAQVVTAEALPTA